MFFILDAARTLFNERGYSQVTIRMIALKLNMSSGNLNYHFKKREDIFEALYFEMVSEFDERINGCFMLFEKMKEKDLMRDSSFEFEFDFLAARMINYGNTWLYSSSLYSNKINSANIDYHIHTFLSILFPFLTSKGKKEFQNLLPEFFG